MLKTSQPVTYMLIFLTIMIGIGLLPNCWPIDIISYPFIMMQQYLIDPIKRNRAAQRTAMHELQEAYDDLLQQHIRLSATADFARDTRDIMQFQDRYNTYTIAQVLERHMHDGHYIVLDKGSRDGVKTDVAVVYKDMLVGKITQVYTYYSRCMLITDPACKIGGSIGSDVQGVMQGAGNGLLRFLHVSHLQHVQPGALVISSGHGLVFPRGFGLGQVLSVEQADLMLNITCKPLVDFNQITYCAVLQ